MTKAISQVINENIIIINFAFIFASFLLILFYVVNVFSVVSKTVTLQKIENKISLLNSNVNNLDSEYLALSGKITPDNLSEFGMKKGQVSQYITRSVAVLGSTNHVALVNER